MNTSQRNGNGTNGTESKAAQLASNAWFMIVGRVAMLSAVPLLLALIHSTNELGKDFAVLQAKTEIRFDSIRNLINLIDSRTSEQYRSTDAARDLKLQDLKMENMTSNYKILEQRLLEMEKRRP